MDQPRCGLEVMTSLAELPVLLATATLKYAGWADGAWPTLPEGGPEHHRRNLSAAWDRDSPSPPPTPAVREERVNPKEKELHSELHLEARVQKK